jgi:hypothetical protein
MLSKERHQTATGPFVFLQLVGFFDWTAFALVSIAKMVGALVFWVVLNRREKLVSSEVSA